MRSHVTQGLDYFQLKFFLLTRIWMISVWNTHKTRVVLTFALQPRTVDALSLNNADFPQIQVWQCVHFAGDGCGKQRAWHPQRGPGRKFWPPQPPSRLCAQSWAYCTCLTWRLGCQLRQPGCPCHTTVTPLSKLGSSPKSSMIKGCKDAFCRFRKGTLEGSSSWRWPID